MSNIITIYQDDDLVVKGEMCEGHPFLHVSVLRFSKSVMKKIKKVWVDIKIGFYYEGYDEIYAVSPNHKFCKVMGGKLQKTLPDNQGVYKWENL